MPHHQNLETLYLKGDVRVVGKARDKQLIMQLEVFDEQFEQWKITDRRVESTEVHTRFQSSHERRDRALNWMHELGIEEAPSPEPRLPDPGRKGEGASLRQQFAQWLRP
jgi:hypothetical protein